MRRFARTLYPAVSLAAALAVWLVVVVSVAASSPPGQGKPAPGKVKIPSAQGAADYVGEAKCAECHPTEADSYKATPHGRPDLERSPAATKGCESCHGPGRQHVENPDKSNIQRFTAGGLAPRDASEVCTTCHVRGTHTHWSGSQHEQRNVGCATCHSVHSSKGEKQIKAATQPELCATCHRNIVNRLYRFNHMPAREGKITCSSCHNPHGSANVKLLKVGTTVDEACTSCHHEKRGPYLWEHAPVANACVTCHDPHGSNNERMLVAKVPFLCQRCHVTSRHPPTVYDAFALKNSASANRLVSMGCVTCHVQIHGSNAPSGKYLHR